MGLLRDAQQTYAQFTEQGAAPTTPATGLWRIYLKSDGLYLVDDAGTETGPMQSPADVTAAVNALVDSAPAALDTLNELAAALGDDANFAATVTTQLAGKAPYEQGGFGDGDLAVWNAANSRFEPVDSGTYATVDGTQRIFLASYYGAALDAVADGSGNWSGTDDSTSIQAAIDAAEASGGGKVVVDGDAIADTTLTIEADEVKLAGPSKRGGSIRFGPSAGLSVPGTSGSYLINRLFIDDLLLAPKNSDARSVPVVDLVGVNAFDFRRVTIQGDTLKSHPAFKSRWTISGQFDNCDIQGGLVGVDAGTVGDSANAFTFVNTNINGCRTGVLGTFAGFTMLGGTVQSCGDGLKISSDIAESSSSIVIDGTYFENNKFHDGTSFTGRDITLGEDAVVRAAKIHGYFASIAADNAFTAGQGASDQAPIRVAGVQGLDVSGFMTGYGADAMVEVKPTSRFGLVLPHQGRIVTATSNGNDPKDAIQWDAAATENDKFQIYRNDNLITRDWNAQELGRVQVVNSPLVEVTGTVSNYDVPFFLAPFDFGELQSIDLLVSDGINVTGTLSVGIAVSPTFYVASAALGVEAGYSNRSLTLNNKRMRASSGIVVIRLNVTAFTSGGRFALQAKFNSVKE